MTGTCHCGALVSAPEDVWLDGGRAGRDARTLHQFGVAMAQHLQQSHQDEFARVGQLGAIMTGWLLMSHFESADPRFTSAFQDAHGTLLGLLEIPRDSQARGGEPPAAKKRRNLIV